MTDKIQNEEKKQNNKSGFEYLTEVIGWLQIVASPLLAGLIIGAIIYLSDPSDERFAIAILVAIIGLIVGIVFATRVWRKQGTIHFVSRVMASLELDNLDEERKSEVEKK